MNAYFEHLGELWSAAGAAAGAPFAPPELDPAMAEQILELARAAAHTQERRFAPLVAFTAGVAAERYRQAGGAAPADLIQAVRTHLEAGS